MFRNSGRMLPMEATGRELQDEIILERDWKEKRVKKGTLGDTDT